MIKAEKEYIRKDDSRIPIELFAHRILDEAGNIDCYYAFINDISQRKKTEAEFQNLEQQFRQAQKMEAVGRLAGGVAHDFNNMLGVINGYASLALEKLNPSDPLYQDIEEIHKAGLRSTEITRQLLAFARKQTIAPEVLDLNVLMDQNTRMLKRLIGEDIDLKVIFGPDLWNVRMDPSQVNQLLINLTINSRDAMADVGEILLESANVTLDRDFCQEHPGSVQGQFVLLTFRDSGCGMDPETLSKIFEPFFTTKGEGKGTGLGLATVYGIVKQNNGFITVQSQPGQGTVFNIYLPRCEQEASSPQSKPGELQDLTGRETILVVEDETSILRLCQKVLERQGYTVMGAETPGEALVLCEKYEGPLHLLITDVVMPWMNGKELHERIKVLKPDIQVLFMSGYTADVIAHRGVLAQGLHFIQKPFSLHDLAQKVREMLGRAPATQS